MGVSTSPAASYGAGAVESPKHYFPRSIHQRVRRSRIPAKVLLSHTRAALSRHAGRIAKKADEHEHFINKVTYSLGVMAFGVFCFLLGARPHDIPLLYAAFFLLAIPLRWIYYRSKKWHYFLLDFCYYANAIFIAYLLAFPRSERLFLLCFAFAEGPLAWALIVWRCSLVFSSVDKITSVLIHLLPGTVIFIIRWWDPVTFSAHPQDETGPWPGWPSLPSSSPILWRWMFLVPLAAYSLWQLLYFLIVEGLRRQRLLRDPEVLTSFRELSRKASAANNLWWRISGVLGDANRLLMYALLQALFTVATMALTVPMFRSYRFHAAFQIFKVAASTWNGGNFFFDVMPRQVVSKAAKRIHPLQLQPAPDPALPSAAAASPTPPPGAATSGLPPQVHSAATELCSRLSRLETDGVDVDMANLSSELEPPGLQCNIFSLEEEDIWEEVEEGDETES